MSDRRKMPKQKPHRSEQDVGTPRPFLNAVEERFGAIDWDLAAKPTNAVAGRFLGPGSPHGEDALAVDWAMLPGAFNGRLWLNPPFGRIGPFAQKCAAMAPAIAGTIMMLAPGRSAPNGSLTTSTERRWSWPFDRG